MLLKGFLFFQLLYVVNELHFPWGTGIPGVAPVNILFVLVLIALRSSREPDKVQAQPILLQPLLIFYGALVFAFLVAQVRAANDVIVDLTYLKNAMFYPLFYLIYLKCKQDEKTTRQLIICVLAIAALAGVEAIKEGLDYGLGNYNESHRASGPFGTNAQQSNRAGVFYAMFMPMFVALALFLRRQKLWRAAAIGGIGLLAAATLFTYSRQSYFILLLGVVVLLLRRSIILAIVLSVTLVSLAGYLPDSVAQRVQETKQSGKHGEETVDVSTASRWEIWEGAMSMYRDHPLGVGLNRFQKEIGNYCHYKGYDAHNFYVLMLAECGPFGLAAFLFLLWTLLRLARFLRANAPPEDPEAQALSIGFTVTTLCMALGGIYGSPHFEGAVMAPYWALCGLLERYIHLKMQNGGGEGSPSNREPSLVERFPLAAHGLPGRR